MKIKLFQEKTPDLTVMENKVNGFLSENEGRITVKDIKYTALWPNPGNTLWVSWTVMVVYDEL